MIARMRTPHDVERVLDDVERLMADGVARARAFPHRVATRPPIDLYDTGTELVVVAQLPGVRPDDLDIAVEQRTLVLQGRAGESLDPEAAKRVTWYRREIAAGEFTEGVPLPVDVEADRVSAAIAEGVLTVTLPKVAQARSRRIPVRAGRSADAAR